MGTGHNGHDGGADGAPAPQTARPRGAPDIATEDKATDAHSSPAGPSAGLPQRRRDARLLGLTFAAAGIDAVSYLGLGHVFPANMTGNTVLLGIGLATGDYGSFTRSATALGAYVLGALLIGTARPGRGWTRTVMVAVVGEVVLLAGLCGWWLSLGGAPAGSTRYGLIALAGVAMGAQSAAVRRLHVRGITTTYITGSWTALSTGVGAWLRRRVEHDRPEHDRTGEPSLGLQAIVLGCYLGGALVCGVGYAGWRAAATAIPLGVLAVVVTDVGVLHLRARSAGR